MGKRIIEVLIGPEGEVIVEGHGFKGPECQEEMKFIEDALGKTADVKKKAEWYLKNSRTTRRLRKIGVDGRKLCG